MRKILICGLLIHLICPHISFAFDDVDTHPRITKLATEKSNIDSILKSQLGVNEGFNTLLKNTVAGKTYSAYEWLWRGSTAEDHPMCRASNHFHNPLKTWDQAGLGIDQISTLSMAIDAYCIANYPQYTKKYSTVKWATGPFSLDPDGVTGATNNDMNWQWARTFYYGALTSSSKAERESYFASTFTAIGQVMHLLEDMAVPAHVRNNFAVYKETI